MNVAELITELQKYPGDHDVQIQYSYSTNGCGCCNGEETTEEQFAYRVFPSQYRDSKYIEGPRGGKVAWRMVDVPSVVIRGEY